MDLLANLIPGLSIKVELYLAEERVVNIVPLTGYYGVILLAIVFLFTTYKNLPLTFFKIFMIPFLGVLITLPFGFLIFDRYMILFMPMFVIVLLVAAESRFSYGNGFKLVVIRNFLFLPFSLNFIFACYFYRENFANYFKLENIFLFNILQQTYQLKDFV